MSKKYKLNLISIISLAIVAKPLPVVAVEEENKQPSMAFFEYLADQVEVDGKLVGPMDLHHDKINNTAKAEKVSNELSQKAPTTHKKVLPNAVSYSETTEDNNYD